MPGMLQVENLYAVLIAAKGSERRMERILGGKTVQSGLCIKPVDAVNLLLTGNILSQNVLERREKSCLKLRQCGWRPGDDESNESRHRFEGIVVEFWIARVLCDLSHDIGQMLQHGAVDRGHGLTGGNDNSHHACDRRSAPLR